MGTAPIKFTSRLVTEFAGRVEEITGGSMGLYSTGLDAQTGQTCYGDRGTGLVWYGPKGARRACAYYFGGLSYWLMASSVELKEDDAEFFRRVREAYRSGGTDDVYDTQGWEKVGQMRIEMLDE